MAKKEKSNHSAPGKSGTGKGKKNRKSNIILWIALIVFLIPCLILGYIILDSTGNQHEPVTADRFKGDLDPAIKDEELKEIETALKSDTVESVSVNLRQATLRILIDTNDDLSKEAIATMAESAYGQVANVLPIDTYFTNQKQKIMYDLEIHVYNVIPDGETSTAQIYYLKSKNAAEEEPLLELLSEAKNPEVADPLLNPKTEPEEMTEDAQNQ